MAALSSEPESPCLRIAGAAKRSTSIAARSTPSASDEDSEKSMDVFRHSPAAPVGECSHIVAVSSVPSSDSFFQQEAKSALPWPGSARWRVSEGTHCDHRCIFDETASSIHSISFAWKIDTFPVTTGPNAAAPRELRIASNSFGRVPERGLRF